MPSNHIGKHGKKTTPPLYTSVEPVEAPDATFRVGEDGGITADGVPLVTSAALNRVLSRQKRRDTETSPLTGGEVAEALDLKSAAEELELTLDADGILDKTTNVYIEPEVLRSLLALSRSDGGSPRTLCVRPVTIGGSTEEGDPVSISGATEDVERVQGLVESIRAKVEEGELVWTEDGGVEAQPDSRRAACKLVAVVFGLVLAALLLLWWRGLLPGQAPAPAVAEACGDSLPVPTTVLAPECASIDADGHREACHWWEATCSSSDPTCCSQAEHHEVGDCAGFDEMLCTTLMQSGCCCWDSVARSCSSPFSSDAGDSDYGAG